MTDVKPCPFCGDAPEWYCDDAHGMRPEGGVIRCGNRDCPVDVSVWGETPDAALDLWNMRAERTCRMENVPASSALQCSNCSSYVATWDMETDCGPIRFCPSCGAKVVSE